MTPWVTRETLTLKAGEAVWTEPEEAAEGRLCRAVVAETPENH